MYIYIYTVWLMPHMNTLNIGSFARNSLTFWCFTRKRFFFIIRGIDDDPDDMLLIWWLSCSLFARFYSENPVVCLLFWFVQMNVNIRISLTKIVHTKKNCQNIRKDKPLCNHSMNNTVGLICFYGAKRYTKRGY